MRKEKELLKRRHNPQSIIRVTLFNPKNKKIIKISYFQSEHELGKKEHQMICQKISRISPYIRFVGVIGNKGELMAYYRRPNLNPMLNERNTQHQFANISINTGLDAEFDNDLGEVEFVWEERKKVQTISFAVKKDRVWISIDRKVIRTELLRIIDQCLPVVKHYS